MNDIRALRQHLFDAIAGVRNGSIELDKARAINEIGKTLIDSGRVEVEYLKTAGGGESSFLDSAIAADNLPSGITGVTRHLLKG